MGRLYQPGLPRIDWIIPNINSSAALGYSNQFRNSGGSILISWNLYSLRLSFKADNLWFINTLSRERHTSISIKIPAATELAVSADMI